MMRKLLCALLALMLCVSCALAETGETFTLWFDGEFSLDLPEGWVSYPVPAEDAGAGIHYILGSADGARFLYIQRQTVAGIDDMDALKAALEAREDCENIQALGINGKSFSFILSADNVSGCATVLNGSVLTFLFQPCNDAEFMGRVAGIMDSFKAA